MDDYSKLPRIHKLPNPLKDSSECTFFLVVNPGLETQARKEAVKHLAATRLDIINGGIQFDSTWGAVRRGQPKLRVASRVLVRVDQFGVRDFQKLYRKVSNISFEAWLKPKVGLLVRAASHTSRLRIKSGIEESVGEAFKKSFKMPPPRPTQELLCLVRVEDDICTISLDLSGELLHKRGSHTDVGVAPLRETWAASIVDRVIEIAAEDEKIAATFVDGFEWIEPMAGTAVFLREALSQQASGTSAIVPKKKTEAELKAEAAAAAAKNAEAPTREFAVDLCYKFKVEAEPKPKTEVAEKSANAGKESGESFDLLKHLSTAMIIDRDEAQLARGKKALQGLVSKVDVQYVAGDAKAVKAGKATRPRLVIVNPPWGQRLKGPDATDTPDGQARLMQQIENDWKPQMVAIVFPRIAGTAPRVPKGWTEHHPLEFRAGGIPVKARFFTVGERSVKKP